MNKNDIDYEVSELKESDLPKIISEQADNIDKLGQKIEKVEEQAKKAIEAAKNANKKIGFWGGRKEAIEELQSSGKTISFAVQENAEALQLSFKFQKDLAEMSKFLLGLGLMNITKNRIVVRELELKMKGASKGELSELAQKELLSVIYQLKAQEDILNKVNKTKNNLQNLNNWINLEITRLTDINKKHNDEISLLSKKIDHLNITLAEQEEVNKQHAIESKEIEKKHNDEISLLSKKIERLNIALNELQDSNKLYTIESVETNQYIKELKKYTKKMTIGFAVAFLLISALISYLVLK